MNGDKKAWKTMEEYNIQDVILLEKLYNKLLPWVKQPINVSLMKKNRDGFSCPTCGKNSIISKGFRYTLTGAYQRYQCKACGAYSTDTRTAIPHAKLKHLS
jgi:transposase-like protein